MLLEDYLGSVWCQCFLVHSTLLFLYSFHLWVSRAWVYRGVALLLHYLMLWSNQSPVMQMVAFKSSIGPSLTAKNFICHWLGIYCD